MTWRRVLGLTYGELTWIAAGLYLLAYELWAVATRGGDVLTRALRANAPRWTLWPIGIGILMGHLFGPRWAAPAGAPWVFVVVLAAALARDLLVRTPVPAVAVPWLFLAAVALGAATWPGRS